MITVYKTSEKKRARDRQYYQEHKEERAANNKRWMQEHPEETKEYKRRWRENHREEIRQRGRDYSKRHRQEHKDYWAKIRVEVLTHYSLGDKPECAGCGETDIRVLCIDHINNGGGQQRKQLNLGGMNFYRWLQKQGYPEGYQTLCWNCNARKEFDRRANT